MNRPSSRPSGAPRRVRSVALLLACTVLGTAHAQVEPHPTLPDSPTRLSSNENAFGYSPNAKRAMIANLDSGSYYNRNEVQTLIELCAERESVPANYILPTPGSGPVLMMTALAYAAPGKNVVTTEMGYTQLIRKFEERGGEVKYAKLGADMGYDFDALKALIDEDTAIVYICNPNNPTGVLADPIKLKQFVLSVPPEVLVFLDEAYLELADTPFAANTCAPLVKLRKNLIVSRTFSKGFGMAGFRIGYGIAHPEVLDALKVFYMGPPTFITAIAAQEALRDKEFLEKTRQNYQEVRQFVCAKFDEMGIEYARPSGAFVYFHTGIDQQKLRDELALHGVLISGSRESGVPEGTYAEWARVSLGTKAQMEQFFGVLRGLLDAQS